MLFALSVLLILLILCVYVLDLHDVHGTFPLRAVYISAIFCFTRKDGDVVVVHRMDALVAVPKGMYAKQVKNIIVDRCRKKKMQRSLVDEENGKGLHVSYKDEINIYLQ